MSDAPNAPYSARDRQSIAEFLDRAVAELGLPPTADPDTLVQLPITLSQIGRLARTMKDDMRLEIRAAAGDVLQALPIYAVLLDALARTDSNIAPIIVQALAVMPALDLDELVNRIRYGLLQAKAEQFAQPSRDEPDVHGPECAHFDGEDVYSQFDGEDVYAKFAKYLDTQNTAKPDAPRSDNLILLSGSVEAVAFTEGQEPSPDQLLDHGLTMQRIAAEAAARLYDFVADQTPNNVVLLSAVAFDDDDDDDDEEFEFESEDDGGEGDYAPGDEVAGGRITVYHITPKGDGGGPAAPGPALDADGEGPGMELLRRIVASGVRKSAGYRPNGCTYV